MEFRSAGDDCHKKADHLQSIRLCSRQEVLDHPVTMVEPSETGRDAHLAMLMRHKWQQEIEQAISRVNKPLTRSEANKWFRKQWYRALAVSKKCRRRISKQQ